MFAVYKKELKSYLLTSTGYIFIGLFLLMFSVCFIGTIFASSVINFEYLFSDASIILMFVIPVLTMRMFAEERKLGTEQLLFTSPRSIWSIVLGKFFAAGTIVAITEVLTLVYFVILTYFGEPSLVVAISTLIGFFLLSLAFISLGMFASSITDNQMVAFIISVAAFLVMYFVPMFSNVFGTFSLIRMFDKFPQGVVSLNEIVAFVSFTVLFILLTVIVLQRRRQVK